MNIKNTKYAEILNKIKPDQIAIAAEYNVEYNLLPFLKSLGLTEWKEDVVEAEGFLFPDTFDVEDSKIKNKAKLFFNYDWGIEFEVLQYIEGDNWHKKQIMDGVIDYHLSFISHLGFHIESEEKLQELKTKFLDSNVDIAQEVWTKSHTNEYVNKMKRKYHYVIFDTREDIGFDIKLIVRIEDGK